MRSSARLGASIPEDPTATLVGRVWDPETGGPRIVHIREGGAADITSHVRSISDVLDADDPVALVAGAPAGRVWALDELDAAESSRPGSPAILAPLDLQVIKGCGVTFARSMIERIIEESAEGDPSKAAEIRARVMSTLGGRLDDIVPGSPESTRVAHALREDGLWSQYLEVGIGPDPEVFTKAPVLSAVGWGATIGVSAASQWSNPEPEIVLVCDSRGRVRAATLGNDVNLRDIEGRSALLLGKAKDNNASAAVGPLLRLLDHGFQLEQLRSATLSLRIDGLDGFSLDEQSDLSEMSRTFDDLVEAVHGSHHQYPDGFAVFTGTPFAPTHDRGSAGKGFTHHPGDVVTIGCRELGTLVNTTGVSEELQPWDYGIRDLARYWERHAPTPEEAPH